MSASTRFRPTSFHLGFALAFSCLLCAPAEARRTVIDQNEFGFTMEVTGDAEDGEFVLLPFPVDYGTGPQSGATIDFGFTPDFTEFTTAIDFSSTDSVFATLLVPTESWPAPEAAVRLSNEQEASTPLDPVDAASIFEFIVTAPLTFVPEIPTPDSGDLGFYTPYGGSGLVQFTDLSSSGTAGDFELLLQCTLYCTSIGFDLNGQTFSSLDEGDGTGSFRFVFRNSASVPEPGTWAMMLLGFAAAGIALRRSAAINDLVGNALLTTTETV